MTRYSKNKFTSYKAIKLTVTKVEDYVGTNFSIIPKTTKPKKGRGYINISSAGCQSKSIFDVDSGCVKEMHTMVFKL